MKKLLFALLFIPGIVFADSKITELNELTTPASDDLLVIVDDVSGTPTTKKIELGNINIIIDHIAILSTGTKTHTTIDSNLDDLATNTTTLSISTDSLRTDLTAVQVSTGILSVSTTSLRVDLDDVAVSTGINADAIALNTTHKTSDGTDHGFIDQDITTVSTPTFAGLIIDNHISGSSITIESTGTFASIIVDSITSNSNEVVFTTDTYHHYRVTVGTGGAGDSGLNWKVNDNLVYVEGVDDSDNDSYKISDSNGFGNGDLLVLNITSGIYTVPVFFTDGMGGGSFTEAQLKVKLPFREGLIFWDSTNNNNVVSTGTGQGQFGMVHISTMSPIGW